MNHVEKNMSPPTKRYVSQVFIEVFPKAIEVCVLEVGRFLGNQRDYIHVEIHF
jgi:hypothetical protein